MASRWSILGALSLVIPLVALVACDRTVQYSGEVQKMNGDAALSQRGSDISKKIGLSLPATAVYEYADFVSGQDDAAQLIVRLPLVEWGKAAMKFPFLEAVYQAEGEGVFHLGPDHGVWQPRKESGLRIAQVPVKGKNQAFNIGVVEQEGQSVKVYVSWYQL